jgi:hypothetical protein
LFPECFQEQVTVLAYIPGQATHIRIKAVGAFDLTSCTPVVWDRQAADSPPQGVDLSS